MLYEESQSFAKNSVMIVVRIMFPVILAVFGYGLFHQVVLGRTFGNQPMSNMGLLLTFIALALLFWWFMQSKLITQVSGKGVKLHFALLIKREILFKSIKEVEVVSYNGLAEHGGWGWRVGPFGVAYTVYGNQAVKLTIANRMDNQPNQKKNRSKTVYIGSQSAEALAEAIKSRLT